jgi:hypothetical protein
MLSSQLMGRGGVSSNNCGQTRNDNCDYCFTWQNLTKYNEFYPRDSGDRYDFVTLIVIEDTTSWVDHWAGASRRHKLLSRGYGPRQRCQRHMTIVIGDIKMTIISFGHRSIGILFPWTQSDQLLYLQLPEGSSLRFCRLAKEKKQARQQACSEPAGCQIGLATSMQSTQIWDWTTSLQMSST